MTTRSALGAVGACLVLAAGCGGDDADAEAFLAEANAICAEFEESIAMIPPPQEALDEWAAIAGDIGDILEAGVNELDALEPPGDLGERYDEWLAHKRETLSATRDLQEAGALLDQERVDSALRRIEQSEGQADELAAELELDECAATAGDS
ncbi:MAG: hypothetical protein ACRDNI_01605 [Gaiellaceae bacterium]